MQKEIDKCIGYEQETCINQEYKIPQNVHLFIIYVTSNSIIERCSKLIFTKFGTKENNFYDQVQNFNWLKQEKSPNFSIV
ncbi:unnamed protein product [Paramecium sonneborni]|uniref:Uncharacterized protein n=1 Tax=Paramecium sonneborni TaxID=65129 RepID=A0A8S1MZZ3_9CILI|nr:unnamed protein product [Paramecium sonneborni]